MALGNATARTYVGTEAKELVVQFHCSVLSNVSVAWGYELAQNYTLELDRC